jgi:hypothetical protein
LIRVNEFLLILLLQPFEQITDLTDVPEGTIVRVITRLDETCREVRDAARVIGDGELFRKMEEAQVKIKRDSEFAPIALLCSPKADDGRRQLYLRQVCTFEIECCCSARDVFCTMSMSDTLSLRTVGVRSPITVDQLLLGAGDDVVPRGTRMLSWRRGGERGELRMPYGGQLVQWQTTAGESVVDVGQSLAVLERCKHPVEWGGMCASCGDEVGTYAVRLTHDAAGPTVSHEEAFRIEQETAERLTKSRKLSLIVDLDQTVVHATVDPTVGEWMAQGEPNPNYGALRDVKRFVLADGSSPDGCWYYIKPRCVRSNPHSSALMGADLDWQTFYVTCPPSTRCTCTRWALVHTRPRCAKPSTRTARSLPAVFSVGTRVGVSAVIAPRWPRLLFRTGMTHKNIERLFPVDQSMVVIIDDRADVWDSHQNNLVKVIPCVYTFIWLPQMGGLSLRADDFFVGIGDINAGLLPKQQDALQLPPGASATTNPPPPPPATTTSDTPPTTQPEPEPEQKTTTPPGSPRPTHAAIPTPQAAADEPTPESNLPITDPTPTDPPSPGESQSTDGSSDSDTPPKPSETAETKAGQPISIDVPPTDALPTPSLSLPTPTVEEVATLESARAKLEARGGPRPGVNRAPSGSGTANGTSSAVLEGLKEEEAKVREEAEEAAAVRESIIEAVREERPLARKLEAMVAESAHHPSVDTTNSGESQKAENASVQAEVGGDVVGRAVLRDDDQELDRIYAVSFVFKRLLNLRTYTFWRRFWRRYTLSSMKLTT